VLKFGIHFETLNHIYSLRKVSLVLLGIGPHRFLWIAVFVITLTLRKQNRLRVFGYGVLRQINGPKTDEVTWAWRRLHSEELHDLHSSPDIIQVIKSRRTRWAVHVARMGEVRTGFWCVNLIERDHLEDRGLYGKVTLQ